MKKILIVDDELEIRRLLQERLEQNKYAVITASNGDEAVELCKTEKPDLILLDIAMPGMDGYEACRKLREEEKTKKTPVVFLTGKDLDEKGIIERCQELSANGYISKLSSLKDLIQKVREALWQ